MAKKTNQQPAFGLNRSADPKSRLECSLPSVDGRAWIPCGSKAAYSQTSMLWEVTLVSFGMGFFFMESRLTLTSQAEMIHIPVSVPQCSRTASHCAQQTS